MYIGRTQSCCVTFAFVQSHKLDSFQSNGQIPRPAKLTYSTAHQLDADLPAEIQKLDTDLVGVGTYVGSTNGTYRKFRRGTLVVLLYR